MIRILIPLAVAIPLSKALLVAAPTHPNAARLPLVFEENVGQAPGQTRYFARGKGYGLFVNNRSLTLWQGFGPDVTWTLDGADPQAVPRAEAPLPSFTNYLLGNDPNRWRTGVKNYARIRYTGVYPGVDLVLYGAAGGELEYDFVVRPGGDPTQIGLRFDQPPALNADGSLQAGQARHQKPVVYQTLADGRRRLVEASYAVSGRQARFALGDYDRSRELVIDPVLIFSTFFGGVLGDYAEAIAQASDGGFLVAGGTVTPNLGDLVPPSVRGSVFVTKFSSTGIHLFTTVLGGSVQDRVAGIALDSANNIYLAGETNSPDFPVVNAAQATKSGGRDAFLVKLNPLATAIAFSTFLGGSADDFGSAIAVNSVGIYLAGDTLSPLLPGTPGTLSPTRDSFLVKYNSIGQRGLVRRFGGVGREYLSGLAIRTLTDAVTGITATHLYTSGSTNSANMPNPRNVFAGVFDGFVGKLTFTTSNNRRVPETLTFDFTRYLGGLQDDGAAAVAIQPSTGEVFVAGMTSGAGFPIVPVANSVPTGQFDAFVVRLSFGGDLLASRLFGGPGYDGVRAIAVNSFGTVALAGIASPGFPFLDSGFGDAASLTGFAARLDTQLNMTVSFPIGNQSSFSAIALDSRDTATLVGHTPSMAALPLQYPIQNAFLSQYGGGTLDAVITSVSLTR